MSGIRKQYDEEFKKNAVKLSHASPKSVKQTAEDLGIAEGLLYRWRKKYTVDGDKTRYATLEEENKALRLQLASTSLRGTSCGRQRSPGSKAFTIRGECSQGWVIYRQENMPGC